MSNDRPGVERIRPPGEPGDVAACRHLIIATAGHVDHGKSTLVRALTGTDPDRLAEEKTRGMTIDLGFAFLDLPGDPPISAAIIDVPGHERFVKNMLSGAAGIDIALLVVAADEGPMPQTREHLDILTVLGVARGVVALTRTDLADDELREIAELTTRDALAGTVLADAPIVRVSAVSGAGLPELICALAREAARAAPRRFDTPFRLPVDRVFSLPGVGTVVTGTLAAGTLDAGVPVELQPQGVGSRARTLQSAGSRIETAVAGMRVAINLPGVDVALVERGSVIAPPGALKASDLVDVLLTVLPGAAHPLRHRQRLRFHVGAGETLVRLHLLAGVTVEPGAGAVPAQLLCEAPVAAARGERFVLRTYSPARAVGGGTVIDPIPARRYRRGAEAKAAATRIEITAAMDGRADDHPVDSARSALADAVYAALLARHEDRTVDEVAESLGVEPGAAAAAMVELAANGRAMNIPGPDSYLSDTAYRRVEETTRRFVGNHHRQYPLRKGMTREALRTPIGKAATVRDFGALVNMLVARGVIAAEQDIAVRLPKHEVVVPVAWRAPMAEIAGVYASAGFTPPSPDNFQANLPRDVNVRAILQLLTDDGKLIHIADDLYLHADAIGRVHAILRRLAANPDGISVGSFRDATGSSRKIVLPLLEYLDSHRVTIRIGDKRVLPRD